MIILNQILIVLGFILCIVRWFYINYKLSIKTPRAIAMKQPIVIEQTVIEQTVAEPIIIEKISIPNYQPQQRSSNVTYEYTVINGYNGEWSTKGDEGWELIIIDNGNFYFKREKVKL